MGVARQEGSAAAMDRAGAAAAADDDDADAVGPARPRLCPAAAVAAAGAAAADGFAVLSVKCLKTSSLRFCPHGEDRREQRG